MGGGRAATRPPCEYIARAFHGTEPLCVLPLRDGKVNVGHDTLTVPLKGFLFVPPGSVASVREFGDLTVFIRRMFICERERDLLPPWARFVRGVIECPLLQPTASREGIHQDENFESVRQALEEQLGRGPARAGARRPGDLEDAWSAATPTSSSAGPSATTSSSSASRTSSPSAPRAARSACRSTWSQSGGTLYYVTRELGSLQEQLLAEGRDVPAIDASWFSVTPFLEKYAQRHPEVGLVQLDGEAAQLLRPAPEGPFAALLDWYTRAGRAGAGGVVQAGRGAGADALPAGGGAGAARRRPAGRRATCRGRWPGWSTSTSSRNSATATS